MKVGELGKHHHSITQLAFEDKSLRNDVSKMRKAENIHEMADSSELLEFFYDETAGTSVLRCRACFDYHCITSSHCKSMTPLQAQQKLNLHGNSTLGTGLFQSQAVTKLLIEGHNQTWYTKKNMCINHFVLLGEGSMIHKKAMDEYRKSQQREERRIKTAMNIFRAAVVDIKLGAAAFHHETLLSLLSSCGVDVGDIGHSRKNFPDIISSIEKTVDNMCTKWLTTPLPSTGFPPHFWATTDKATPSRTTNQAVIIVGRTKSGEPTPVPVDAPAVYSNNEVATYEKMAELVIGSISSRFTEDVLSRVCGIAADGPYQATSFRQRLLELLDINDTNPLALPVTWDPAHLLNLGVTDVKDGSSASGIYLRRFIKRCNVFNTILAHGKGFAYLQSVDSNAKRPVSFATQRFASSSYQQWIKIYDSFQAYYTAFEELYPVRIEEEEYQYMIAGYDFVLDLIGLLDLFKPLVDLMLRVQSLNTPIWKLKQWWPIVKSELQCMIDNDDFPTLKQYGTLNPGDNFKGVTLLDGWLLEEAEGKFVFYIFVYFCIF